MVRRIAGNLFVAVLLATTLAFVAPGASPSASAASSQPFGYWMVASDGGVFSFGGTVFAGSTGSSRLNRPIVGMAATPSGRGYWLVASDGGVFTFGDARFFGSTGGMRLNQPIVAAAATPSGRGYWLVASDGGVFTFGDARFFGSTGGMRLNQPIVAAAATPSGNGYWLVASDGGVFTFGDAVFRGSTGALRLNAPIVGMAATPSGGGYWLVASDGGVFTFGDAAFRGSTGSSVLKQPIVGMAAGPSTNPYFPGSTGYDISWPQCGGSFPARPFSFGIVGTTHGTPFTVNPCFGAQWAWAGDGGSVYIVLSRPNGPSAGVAGSGPAGTCAAADDVCRSYNFGWKAAQFSAGTVSDAGATPLVWWLDVETASAWSSNQFANAMVVRGAIDYLASLAHTVGVYSTSYQWGVITGGYQTGRPIWIGGAPAADPASRCQPSYAFGGGKTWLTQFPRNGYDGDYACAVN